MTGTQVARVDICYRISPTYLPDHLVFVHSWARTQTQTDTMTRGPSKHAANKITKQKRLHIDITIYKVPTTPSV